MSKFVHIIKILSEGERGLRPLASATEAYCTETLATQSFEWLSVTGAEQQRCHMNFQFKTGQPNLPGAVALTVVWNRPSVLIPG